MGRIQGEVTTTSTNEVPVNKTTYTEQTSGAQRSVKSSSASDAAAGSGVRKVRITYFKLASDGSITGPLTEDVTLNGTAAVPTVATDIALIEKVEAISCGSGGVAAGTITLYDDNAGGGSAICSIATGDVRTALAHHYVASGRRCYMQYVQAETDGGLAVFALKAQPFPKANLPEAELSRMLTGRRDGKETPFVISGPARVRLMVKPPDAQSQTARVDVAHYEL